MRFYLTFILLAFANAIPHPDPANVVPALEARAADPAPLPFIDNVGRDTTIYDERDLELMMDERGEALAKRDPTGRCIGNKKPKSKGVPIVPNGCGPGGKLGDLVPEGHFGGCCDTHDRCYSTCSRSRLSCDDSFHSCMKGVCGDKFSGWRNIPKRVICTGKALIYYRAVRKFGLIPFLSATKKHCKCV